MLKNYFLFSVFLFIFNYGYTQKPDYQISNNAVSKSIQSNENLFLAKTIKIYPNPVNNILFINSKIRLKKIEIYNLLGQRVKIVNKNFNSIHLEDLTKGIYMIKIHSEKGTVVKKLIKR